MDAPFIKELQIMNENSVKEFIRRGEAYNLDHIILKNLQTLYQRRVVQNEKMGVFAIGFWTSITIIYVFLVITIAWLLGSVL